MIVAGTGHRPEKLGLSYGPADFKLLTDFVRRELSRLDGVSKVISGYAAGFDQALAVASLQLGLPVVAAIPFVGMEDKWPKPAKRFFNDLIDAASEVHVLSEGPYNPDLFIKRDHWMVDRADLVLALFDERETKTGTGATVRYARKKRKRVRNVWKEWVDRDA